jgi:1,4-dihydroxy-2-naphthoyl-CoA hydrolase
MVQFASPQNKLRDWGHRARYAMGTRAAAHWSQAMLPLQKSASLEDLYRHSQNTANAAVQFNAIGDDWLEGTLALDDRTRDRDGSFHSGAFSLLAETLGSVACSLSIDTSRFVCVGQSIDLHHPNTVREGPIRGRASCVSSDDSNQVWIIEIRNSSDAVVCIATLTMAIIPRETFTSPRDPPT